MNRHKKELRDEEKASGITPDEPSDLDLALNTIIDLEESADTKIHDADFALKEKIESDKAKAEGIRLKAMENYRRPERESLLVQITVKISVEEAAIYCSIYHKVLSLIMS